MTAHINIGSNLGDRAANIHRAALLVSERIGRVTAESTIIETEAWGYDSHQSYLNQGINVDTEQNPAEIICQLQKIEQEIAPGATHRDKNSNYIDRRIDLDLICLDSIVSTDAAAIIPHPRMHMREFVLRPLAEIWPEWTHPVLNLTPKAMLDAINADENTLNKC